MKRNKKLIWLYLALAVACSCVKPFIPPVKKNAGDYLVVEGKILAGAESTIKLSRTRPLGDTTASRPEKNAQVFIESSNGDVYSFQTTSDGVYVSVGSAVSPALKYRLKIITSAGKTYESDYVAVKETPAIDSVEWDQDDNNDVHVYVNTHDPSNKSRYYMWDYVETYEYHAAFESYATFKNGEIIFLDPEEYRYACYTTLNSNDILLGTSASLTNDVIRKAHITRIPNDNSKISFRYSILVNQYAITADAYNYWQILKQNSEPGGEIFDPQPSQLHSNIHCTSDAEEPVIGFVSACSVKQQRIFMLWSELEGRVIIDNSVTCKETLISVEEAPKFLADGTKDIAYFVGNGGIVAIAPVICVDCRLRGGVTEKPSFW